MEPNRGLIEAQTPNKEYLKAYFEVDRWLKGRNKGTQHI
jgi:hypothetical protein